MLDSDTGAVKAAMETCGDAEDVFFDDQRYRIYASWGSGSVDVFEAEGQPYRVMSRIATKSDARTSLFVPELDRLFATQRAGPLGSEAALPVFRPNPMGPYSAKPSVRAALSGLTQWDTRSLFSGGETRGEAQCQPPEQSLPSNLRAASGTWHPHAEPAVYADEIVEEMRNQLLPVDGVLVWVDPIHEGKTWTVLVVRRSGPGPLLVVWPVG